MRPGQRTGNGIMRIKRLILATALVAAAAPTLWTRTVNAAETAPAADPHAGHTMTADDPTPAETGTMPAVDHSGMDHETGTAADMSGMDHGSTSMQGGSAPADARDPYAYSDGYDFGPYPLMMADHHRFGTLLVDRLEAVHTRDGDAGAYDLQARYGRDYNRAVLKAEGEAHDGRLEQARTELLWSHALAAYWDGQLGARYDSSPDGPERAWLALGIQGLAPYWFEVDATAYVGDRGRTALRLATEYELLLTQRLILQPRAELNVYGNSDVDRNLGSGLSDLVAGLRLRYEIRRQFAPYIGIEWAGKYGETADLARAAGGRSEESRWVAGLRFWY